MEENKQERNSDAAKANLRTPVEQMRPDESEECINTPPTAQEVKAAVEEMNPDENSMNSRG